MSVRKCFFRFISMMFTFKIRFPSFIKGVIMSEKIKSSVLSFPVFFEKINDYSIEDDRFTKIVSVPPSSFLFTILVKEIYLSFNSNNSIFDKNVINDAIPTLEYIPIVGFIEDKLFEDKDFTGHKYIIFDFFAHNNPSYLFKFASELKNCQ